MTSNLCKFLLVDYAEKLDFETTSFDVLEGYIAGFLSAADGNVELLVVAVIEKWADSCASARLWSVLENPYFLQRFWVDNLGMTVSGAGHKHCEIMRHKKLENLLGVQIF